MANNITDERFPNGFESWVETHHEAVEFITRKWLEEPEVKDVIADTKERSGHKGLYDLGLEWANAFELKYKGQDWSQEDEPYLDYFEEVETFFNEKNKL